ncbi:unnamed protein product [Hydatigera taeniaeformis]|uniref:Protein kinase domain-containing protein n=1 Tax=Hydatigena taeniaeformis TaxID=6205 RepID=A0A0R3X8Z7_HYDTA|nr:unnamed protein product [Hydatigera taeniaeformis]
MSLMLWKRLTHLHEKFVLRHASLSGIKAADVCTLADLRHCTVTPSMTSSTIGNNFCAFIISEFYPWGSFFNYMQLNSATDSLHISSDLTFVLRALIDIVNGITFLHIGKFKLFRSLVNGLGVWASLIYVQQMKTKIFFKL